MAKHKDWSGFKIHCSRISEIMVKPKEFFKPPPAKDFIAYNKLIAIEQPTATQQEKMKAFELRLANYYEPPRLSETAVKYLIKRYAHERYGSRMAAVGLAKATAAKGNALEAEAVEILSRLHKIDYKKPVSCSENDYLLGRCDAYCLTNKKVVDVKTAWNINTFMLALYQQIPLLYWFKMQGYLELYDCDYGEICYVLLNTPAHLIEQERDAITKKYMFGEVNKERYEDELEKLSTMYSYDRIPLKRRVITFSIERDRAILPKIYSKVEMCRQWLNEFEKRAMSNDKIIYLPKYNAIPKEDNSESDPSDMGESNTEG